MPKKIYLIISFFYLNICSGQSFFTIDIDTNEFIENVNYSLFLKKKKVFNSITENKKITTINNEIEFDSISFSRIDYNTLGFPKTSIDSIISLKKKTIYLDEVVVGSKKDDYLLIGETNRFIKKQSRAFNEELIFGIVHKNDNKKEIELKKIAFFTEKIHYKTAYKINLFEVNETLPKNGNQYAEIGNLIYSTDTLYLDKTNKGKKEVAIDSELIMKPNSSIFISIELLYYLDEDKTISIQTQEKRTKLKFQLSNETNYYSKTIDFYTKITSDKLLNINLMINFDFANQLFLKPHKSILVTPAIILYAKEHVN
jgi:hypothetical protein